MATGPDYCSQLCCRLCELRGPDRRLDWTIYDGAPWPAGNSGLARPIRRPALLRPNKENLYIEKPVYDPELYTNAGTWTRKVPTHPLICA